MIDMRWHPKFFQLGFDITRTKETEIREKMDFPEIYKISWLIFIHFGLVTIDLEFYYFTK